MEGLGVPFSQSLLVSSSAIGICSMGKPTQGDKTFYSWNLHFLTMANREITPFSSVCVRGFEKTPGFIQRCIS